MGKDRYPGVKPFTAEQHEVFFGRSREKDELLKLIDLETLVVLHSKSGLGKSSLLNAAVLPEVQRTTGLAPISVRFFAYQGQESETPADKLQGELEHYIGQEGAFLDPLIGGAPTIWSALKKIQARQKGERGVLLVFDQFEELFSYPGEAIKAFAEQLASAVFVNIPQDVLNRFEEQYLEDESFLSDAEMELLHEPFKVKLLLSIRSDRLSLLPELSAYFPKVLNRLYRLKPLSVESAEEAILRPAYLNNPSFGTPPFDYTDEALEHIIDYLTKGGGDNIESYQLQILCHHIEKNILPAKENLRIEKPDLGNLDTIYENYYAYQIAKLGDEDTQLAARRFIEEGLIQEEDERRLSMHGSQITQFYGVSQPLLDQLVNTRLIRPEAHRKGGHIYELSHDSIVKPILKAKRRRVAEEKEKAEAELTRQQEAEAQRLQEEYRKEQQRVKYYRLLLVLAVLVIVITLIASTMLMRMNLAKQKLEIKSEIQQQNARSSEFTSFAMLESNIDRTLALNLAKRALELNDSNEIAQKVRNDLLIDVETFPFYEKIIQGHSHYVSDLDISSDGKFIVSGSLDKKVRIWSQEGELIQVLEGHEGQISDVDWLENGRIASSDRAGKARIWKADGTLEREFNNGYAIADFEISPNGKLFVAAGVGGYVQIWNRQGRRLKVVRVHGAEISSVSFVGEDQLITASFDRSIKLLNLTDYTEQELVSALPAGVQNIDYFPAKNLLAAGLINGQIKIWSFEGNERLRELITVLAHNSRVSDITFTDNGNKVLTCSWDKSAKLWSLEGYLLKTFLGHKDGLRAIAISEEREVVITGGEDKTLKIWSMRSLSERTFRGFTEDVSSVAFSADSKYILIGSYDQSARLFSVEGRKICDITQGTAIYDVAINGSGDLLATVGKSQKVYLWDRNGKLKKSFEAHKNVINSVSFSTDGQRILTSGADGIAKIWDMEGKAVQSFSGHKGGILKAIFSEDGQYVLTAGKDGTARLWSLDGQALEVVNHTDRVNSVAFSPDDRYFLTGSWDNSFKKWSLKGDLRVDFIGHYSDVNEVACSKDGRKILSASSDNTVRLWQADGRELPSIIRHSQSVTDAAFSPDGKLVITGSRDHTARLWRLEIINEVLDEVAPPDEVQKQRYGLK